MALPLFFMCSEIAGIRKGCWKMEPNLTEVLNILEHWKGKENCHVVGKAQWSLAVEINIFLPAYRRLQE